jgi:aerobic carbon-monoxide dehydrogenase large subunit
MAVIPKFVGERIKRREDPRLITGEGLYVDDVRLPGMLTAVILRSPYAHAKINSINLDTARKLPGVVAVFSGDDFKDKIASVPCVAPAEHVPYHPVLAQGKVRFVGEGVAVAVAQNAYIAHDALDLIDVDYDALDAVVNPEKALEADAPILHEEFKSNSVTFAAVPNAAVDEAMKKADKIIRFRIHNQRLAPVPMEPRGVVARWDRGYRQLTIWSSTQIPHLMRSQVAEMLGLGENKVRVIAPEVGGGFGAKLNVYAEEALTAYLSMTLKRPVKWIERRRENLSGTTHGRDQITYIEVAANKDGEVLALKGKFICDMGAYLQLLTPAIPGFSGLMMTGCYKIPALAFDQQMVFTNKMATDAYRGAGRPEAALIAERAMEEVAIEFGLDPAEVRRKNFIPKSAFPAPTAGGLVYDSGDYELTLSTALAAIDYRKVREEQAAALKQGRYIGIGLASYVEICGIGPSALLPPKLKGGGWESGTVRIEPDAKVYSAHWRIASWTGPGDDLCADGRRRIWRRYR